MLRSNAHLAMVGLHARDATGRKHADHPARIFSGHAVDGAAHGPAAHDRSRVNAVLDERFGGIAHAQADGVERTRQVLRLDCAEPADDLLEW